MPTSSFTQLDVWKKAHQVTLEIYRITERFPRHQRFGLTSQMQRAAVSIPANVAEGYGRRRAMDKARFYTIAAGSSEELKYYLILSKDLQYTKDIESLCHTVEDVSRMLRRLTEATVSSP